MTSSWPSNFADFSPGTVSSLSQTKKRKYESSNGHQKSTSRKKELSAWVDRYHPTSFDELAVHKKKVAEVDAWISHSQVSRGAPILLLTGPTGCGKTATVLITAAAHSVEIQEWTNPLSVSYDVTREAGLHYESLASQFEDFLFRCGRYPSLTVSNKSTLSEENNNTRKILLLEDLPYHILREPTQFRDVLRQYTRHQKNALIIILSDGSIPDSTKRNLLPPDVITQLKIHTISFNPIATTSMTKALTRIVSSERQKLSKEHLSQIVTSSSGDIRTAINSLQFLLQKGVALSLAPQPKRSKSLKRRKSFEMFKTDALPAVGGKDVSLLLFRALGKILYCKREEKKDVPSLPPHLSHYFRDPLIFEPEEILERCCLSGSAYSLFLHHNCTPFFSNMDNLTSVLDNFCLADIIGTRRSGVDFSSDTTTALDSYEGSITSRAVAFWNTSRATAKLCDSSAGQWRPLHKPSWYQVNKKCNENQSLSHGIFWNLNLPSEELFLTLLPYIQKLAGARKNREFLSRSGSCDVQLDPAQKDFLFNVINLPKWKAFASGYAERIAEGDTGDQSLEEVDFNRATTSAVDGQKIDQPDEDPEEDFKIDDFDD